MYNKAIERGVRMFNPISIDAYLQSHKKNNPGENIGDLRKALIATVKSKKEGAVCHQCGQPIWAIGTAVVGWNGCFTCITGEADPSDDYEIDSVCF
jgi:hypothetical protein